MSIVSSKPDLHVLEIEEGIIEMSPLI